MCGRTVMSMNRRRIRSVAGVSAYSDESDEGYHNYNLCPTSKIPIVIEESGSTSREVKFVKWGLEPRFVPSQPLTTINARVEGVRASKVFSPLIETNRCVIIVDAFYEWTQSKSDHTPYHIRYRDDIQETSIPSSTNQGSLTALSSTESQELEETKSNDPDCILPLGVSPLLIAGLYDVSKSTGEYTCTILTTESAGPTAKVHNRMPLLVSPEVARDWLNCSTHSFDQVIPNVIKTCRSLSESLTCTQVSSLVNSISNKSRDFTLPVSEWKKRSFEKGLGRFFIPSKKAKPDKG